jgi:chemosensory pili system protein ChpA (sensor histidine kinase/response regulator)
LSEAAAPLLDEMARRAQERLLLAQVAREIQANLRHMEHVLDAFFRDHDKRADLATLAHDSKQILGALKILGLEHAGELLALCQNQIEEYAKPDTRVADEDLELLAESLSGLGFYIEAVEQQRPDRERLIEPLLAKRLGIAAKPPADDRDTVEAAVADLKAALPATLAAFQRQAGEASARERLDAELTTLKNDAELIGDATLQADADAALDLLARSADGDSAALQDAIAAISEDHAAEPAPAPSEETIRLLETDASQLDAELLDIYLTEADEVIDSVASNVAALKEQPDDRDALTTVRRGFHTLKGSGRMVGLTELGEIAYAIERVHNRVLEEDLPVTPAMLALIDTAQTSFRVWVDTLRRKGRVTPDASGLRAAIAKAEAEMQPTGTVTAAPVAVPSIGAVVTPTTEPSGAPLIEVIELDETLLTEAGASGSAAPEVIEFAPQSTAAKSAEPAAAPPPVAAEPEEVTIGDVTLSTALHRILCDEALQHVATLDAELQALQFNAAATPSQTMVRASHTLCGIHRTGGFPLLATTAKALEQCLLGLEERGAPLPSTAQPVLARAVAGLRVLSARVRSLSAFNAADEAEAGEIVAELEALRQEAMPAAAVDDSESFAARAVAEEEAQAQAPPPAAEPIAPDVAPFEADAAVVQLPAAGKPARASAAAPAAQKTEVKSAPEAKTTTKVTAAPTQAADETLANVHDDVDEQVLPIFLEEATELFPQAGEQLRAWQRNPANQDAAQALRRTLHTFKGSARMAGAMRLGELTHSMESRLLAGDVLAVPTSDLFDALDTDLDRLAFVLDRLHKGELNTPLPWLDEEGTPAAAPAAPAPLAVVPTAAAQAPRPAAAAQPVAAAPEAETAQRAMLRVRADLIDRLVNEAGEVAISRARVEGELRSLKGNLLELTNSVIRMRSQVREIEIQAESQIQSRSAHVKPGEADFDPLEFDRFTRFQELTRSLAEGVNDVSTVQQSLLRNIDDADAALLAGAPLARCSAATLLHPHRPLREPFRAALPDHAADREGARQARKSGDPRNTG